MKTLFRPILKAARAKVKKLLVPQGRKNPAYKFNPAPSYWALVPVKPQDVYKAKLQGRR